MEDLAWIRIHFEVDRLSWLHPMQLRFFIICLYPDILKWHNGQRGLSRLYHLAHFQLGFSNYPRGGRSQSGMGQVVFGLASAVCVCLSRASAMRTWTSFIPTFC